MPGHAAALAIAMSGFLHHHGHWDQAAAMHQTALTAACHAGDQAGQADALTELGILRSLTGDYPAAVASRSPPPASSRPFGQKRDSVAVPGLAAMSLTESR